MAKRLNSLKSGKSEMVLNNSSKSNNARRERETGSVIELDNNVRAVERK